MLLLSSTKPMRPSLSLLLLAAYGGAAAVALKVYYVVPDLPILWWDGAFHGLAYAQRAATEALKATGGALLVLLGARALGAGALKIGGFHLAAPLERSVFSLAIGFVVLSLVSQALAYAGLYNSGLVRLMVLLAAVCGLAIVARDVRTWSRPRVAGVDRLWMLLAGLGAGVALIGSLAPEIEYDALWYHLWLPQQWLEAGRPVDHVEEYISLYPLGWDLAYGAALTVGGAGAAKLLHFACLLLLATTTGLLCREIAPCATPWLAAALTIMTPTILWEATTAYVDLALSWYVAAAALALLRFQRTGATPWLVLGAVLLGGALSIKHLGMVAGAIIGTALLVAQYRQRRALRHVLRVAIVLAVVSLSIPSPWYARAYVAARNPVFPDLFRVFGAEPGTRWDHQAEQGLSQFKAKFGRERTPLNLARLPWDMTMHGARYGGAIGPLFLLLAPVGLAFARTRALAVTGVGCLAYLAVWASPISSFQMRFILPLIPFFAIMAAAGAARLSEQAALAHRRLPAAVVAVVAAAMILNLPMFSEWHDGERHHGRWLTHVTFGIPLPVVIGAEGREDYLDRRVPSYRAWQYINEALPAGARVLTFSGGDHFYSRRARLWSDAAAARPMTWAAAPGDESRVFEELRHQGVTHVLLDEALAAEGVTAGLALLSAEMRSCCLVEVYRDRRYSLQAIVSDGRNARADAHERTE
jgi:hypothetical protein